MLTRSYDVELRWYNKLYIVTHLWNMRPVFQGIMMLLFASAEMTLLVTALHERPAKGYSSACVNPNTCLLKENR